MGGARGQSSHVEMTDEKEKEVLVSSFTYLWGVYLAASSLEERV